MRNLRDSLRSIVPNWLSDRPILNVGFAVLFTIALMGDCLLEALFEGMFAAWPGRGTNTALSLIGQSRGIIRGVNETDAAYASRLIDWLAIWYNAGRDTLLLQLLQNYVGGNLPMRLITRAGQFVSIDSSGTITFDTDTSWNWDTVVLPERATWWSDIWVIVYVTDAQWDTFASLTDPAWTAAWGTYTNGACYTVPLSTSAGITSIIRDFRGVHTWLEAIVFTDDTARFIPGALGPTDPKGGWGNWSRDIGGVQTPGRDIVTTPGGGLLRYMVPTGGG